MIDEYASSVQSWAIGLPSFFGVSLSEHLVEIAFDEGLYGIMDIAAVMSVTA